MLTLLFTLELSENGARSIPGWSTSIRGDDGGATVPEEATQDSREEVAVFVVVVVVGRCVRCLHGEGERDILDETFTHRFKFILSEFRVAHLAED